MSYSVKLELCPHADPAKTIGVYVVDAAGTKQRVSYLHEVNPKVTISVPPGRVLSLEDEGLSLEPAIAIRRADSATKGG